MGWEGELHKRKEKGGKGEYSKGIKKYKDSEIGG